MTHDVRYTLCIRMQEAEGALARLVLVIGARNYHIEALQMESLDDGTAMVRATLLPFNAASDIAVLMRQLQVLHGVSDVHEELVNFTADAVKTWKEHAWA